ncbi:acyl-CoA dehydrogenase family protein [Streptomyces polygonati]|uniref:Acyl-CoA dehydrogenase family protein n=1 Tax=Streptomyces polygonati TaxID=1617087 RepID=A0ABV8HV65_9ACTN
MGHPSDDTPSTGAAERYRQQTRRWIRAHAPAAPTGPEAWPAPAAAHWERALLDAGLICADWPARYGGSGLGAPESLLLDEEFARAGLPRIRRGAGERVVGPVLLAHGTEEQKDRLLPRIVSGQDTYCVAFAEAGHGSDLASVRTRGEVAEDGAGELRLTGRKSWVQGVERADRALVLCRTDPAAPGTGGLTLVVVGLDPGNGVARRTVQLADGGADCGELEFDGARAPLSDIVGGPGGAGGGWPALVTALAYERAGRAASADLGFQEEFWDLVREAGKTGAAQDPLVRDRLAWAYTRITALRLYGRRAATRGTPGADPAVAQLLSAEYRRRFGEIALDVTGAAGLVRPEGDGYPAGRWQHALLAGRAETIRSGTGELLRDAVAERLLGLPEEPGAGPRAW